MHPGTAVQSDNGGIRACAIGLGQIALNAVARNQRAHALLRGAFKLYALQRCGPCISHQRTYDAAKHQHYRGLESDCSRHGVSHESAPEVVVRVRSLPVSTSAALQP